MRSMQQIAAAASPRELPIERSCAARPVVPPDEIAAHLEQLLGADSGPFARGVCCSIEAFQRGLEPDRHGRFDTMPRLPPPGARDAGARDAAAEALFDFALRHLDVPALYQMGPGGARAIECRECHRTAPAAHRIDHTACCQTGRVMAQRTKLAASPR